MQAGNALQEDPWWFGSQRRVLYRKQVGHTPAGAKPLDLKLEDVTGATGTPNKEGVFVWKTET